MLLIIFLLVFSACFSSFETALFSLTPLQRYRLIEAGGVSTLIGKILEKPREFLTTVLLGNELVNVAISILSAALAYDLLVGHDQRTIYLASTGVATLVLLIAGEIVPKNIAVRFPVVVSQFLVVPFQLFAWVVTPFRAFLAKIADLIVRLFGADPRKGRRLIVEEELRSLLETGQKAGTLADLERTLIQNALDFSGQKLFKVMTQREKIVAVSVNTLLPDILKSLEKKRYSRIPVYDQNLNQVLGILHAKELLPFRLKTGVAEIPSLRGILKPHVEVTADESLDQVFQKFQQYRVHMGIVRDKTQKVIGLITMDDLLRRFFP